MALKKLIKAAMAKPIIIIQCFKAPANVNDLESLLSFLAFNHHLCNLKNPNDVRLNKIAYNKL